MRAHWLLGLLVALLAAGPVRPEGEEVKSELKKLQGAWVVAKLTYNGEEMDSEKLGKITLAIKGDQATVVAADRVKKEYARLKLTLDPRTTPKTIDMNVVLGSKKGETMEGIYEVRGDDLKICAKVIGSDRPTKFASPPGESIVLVELKRKKE